MEVFHIIEWILFTYMAIGVGYIALFSVASVFFEQKNYPETDKIKRFIFLIPAYKEDKVIHECVTSILQQDYPIDSFDIIVISDQMEKETNDSLKQKKIHLLEIKVEESSKAKALQLAATYIQQRKQVYDNIIIIDADNIISTNYLRDLNKAIQNNSIAIQTHRKAKSINTKTALLDAFIEEVNNSIFRKGHIRLGLSSALIGSGMIFEYTWFMKNIVHTHSAGEDKELEELLLRQCVSIEYLDHIEIMDEKVAKKQIMQNQRRRWIATQFFLARIMLSHLPTAIVKRNKDYIIKTIQELIPPRSILSGIIILFASILSILHPIIALKWWGLFILLVTSFYIAIPNYMRNKDLWIVIKQIPFFIFVMTKNLFRLKGMAQKFTHTQHG